MIHSLIKFIFFFTCIGILFSCGKKEKKEVKIPEGMMSEETFTRVLIDFALAESAANMNIKAANIQKLDSIYAFNPLRDNGVTQSQYDSAITFYVGHPDLYKKIYENILAELSDMQTKRNPLVKDSSLK